MKRLLFRTVVALAGFATLAILAIYFFPHVFWIHLARYQFPPTEAGYLYEKPVKLPAFQPKLDSSISNHRAFNFGKLQFRTVWPDAEKIKETTLGVAIFFPGPKELHLAKPGQVGVRELVMEKTKNKEFEQIVFGKDNLKSNFAVHKRIIEVSLTDSPKNRVEMVRMMTLTVLKSISYPAIANRGTFSFETDQIRGWQFGDVNKKKLASISFYDRKDVIHEMVAIGMTQREINAILATMTQGQKIGRQK